MDIEELARQMREHAIRVEREEEQIHLSERKRRREQIQAMQTLYFNAGRWAGGARDRAARQAFEKVSLTG